METTTNTEALDIAKEGARLVRNAALDATDKMMAADYPLTATELTKVKAYRKFLRDLPATMSDEDFMTFKGVPTLAEFKPA